MKLPTLQANLLSEDVGQALLSVVSQTGNCYVAELRLASNDVRFL